MFHDHHMGRMPAKTQENFNKNSIKDTPNIYHRSLYSNPGDLNQELWKQNFEALKTSYLKVMGKVNQENKAYSQYKFDNSDNEEAEENQNVAKHLEYDREKTKTKYAIPTTSAHAQAPPDYQPIDVNQYERYRQTFQDDKERDNNYDDEEDDDDDRFNEFEPSMGLEEHNKKVTVLDSAIINITNS